MNSVAWELAHSVETAASPAVAWSYWTNVSNWADPPAEFEFHGPFAAGSQGTTRMPGQEPVHWIIRDVIPGETATIELQLDGATLWCVWRFEGLDDGRTRLTQRLVLRGENAEAYRTQVDSAFRATLPDGMNRIARAMAGLGPAERSAGP